MVWKWNTIRHGKSRGKTSAQKAVLKHLKSNSYERDKNKWQGEESLRPGVDEGREAGVRFCAAHCNQWRGICAPHVSSPLWSQRLFQRVSVLQQPWQVPCDLQLWGISLLSCSSQVLQAPWSTWDGVPGWLTGHGCCWEQKGLMAGSLPWGKSFHAEMSQLGLSGETDGSLQNLRGKHENIPPVYDNKLEMAKGKST